MATDTVLDPNILPYVEVLRAHGVETIESCQGGPGHSRAGPYISFRGPPGEGLRVAGIAQNLGWPITRIVKEWAFFGDDITTPVWVLKLRHPLPPAKTARP
ncbi:MAG: hypothetical protein OXU75_11150 [Deltaproteobacteria bacterium]|nr:hypothetical protein [Deltaproteobacteria bacterium]